METGFKTQKDDFNQKTACIAPVDLLKYTTLKERGGAQILSSAPGAIRTRYSPVQQSSDEKVNSDEISKHQKNWGP